MSTPASQPLPKTVLLKLLPASFEPWGASSWYRAQAPTEASVQRIYDELRIALRELFVEIAAAFSSYGGWFNSIGEDYESHMHIVSLNRAFVAEGLSARYVLLNHGHDGDCDAWDKEAAMVGGEFPIVYFNYDTERKTFRGLRPSALTFEKYIDAFVRAKAPKCPVDNYAAMPNACYQNTAARQSHNPPMLWTAPRRVESLSLV